jgi:hypothetical protein
MILYLVKKYLSTAVILTVALTIVPNIMFKIPIRAILPYAILFSWFISPAVIYYEFKNQNIWPLYDNLLMSKFFLLGLFSGIHFIIYVGIQIWIN